MISFKRGKPQFGSFHGKPFQLTYVSKDPHNYYGARVSLNGDDIDLIYSRGRMAVFYNTEKSPRTIMVLAGIAQRVKEGTMNQLPTRYMEEFSRE